MTDDAGKVIYKNGKNTFVIDDKMTWSYISTRNAEILSSTKEYTDTLVQNIYQDILGGGEAVIPFQPREDRPVYCSECFAKMKEE